MMARNLQYINNEKPDDSVKTILAVQKGRSRWEIIRDILRAVQDDRKVKKTRIMQKAYLDWRTFNRYFDYLLNNGFIEMRNTDESYILTEKGKDFVARLREVEDVLGQA